MKDLLLYTADADAMGFMRSILNRPKALGIRNISFDIERHPLRDSGMIQSAAELTRMKKGMYSKALLMWDHHGSGRDRHSPQVIAREVQHKLDQYTWSGNSAVTVLMPELEEWLWCCEQALARYCNISAEDLLQWTKIMAGEHSVTVEELRRKYPKELFEHVMRDRLRRTISPKDFEKIGEIASIRSLEQCESFNTILVTLKMWFSC